MPVEAIFKAQNYLFQDFTFYLLNIHKCKDKKALQVNK